MYSLRDTVCRVLTFLAQCVVKVMLSGLLADIIFFSFCFPCFVP